EIETSVIRVGVEIAPVFFARNSGNRVSLSSEYGPDHETPLHIGVLLPGAAGEHKYPVARVIAFVEADLHTGNDGFTIPNVKNRVINEERWLKGKVHELILGILRNGPSQHAVDWILRGLAVIVAVDIQVETLTVRSTQIRKIYQHAGQGSRVGSHHKLIREPVASLRESYGIFRHAIIVCVVVSERIPCRRCIVDPKIEWQKSGTFGINTIAADHFKFELYVDRIGCGVELQRIARIGQRIKSYGYALVRKHNAACTFYAS